MLQLAILSHPGIFNIYSYSITLLSAFLFHLFLNVPFLVCDCSRQKCINMYCVLSYLSDSYFLGQKKIGSFSNFLSVLPLSPVWVILKWALSICIQFDLFSNLKLIDIHCLIFNHQLQCRFY